ncbi:matrixin family metalloprotease [Paenarthrobacter sp. 2TAF44]|uniref:matrixin family metalloprotease n=1 Tax=Paenarthrobacter sp. 2TAF44 TaxID=3233018 RepID=UPI003F986927
MTTPLKRSFIAVVITALLAIAPATSAHAATPIFGHRYQNGVGSIGAWLNYGSGVGNWEWAISSATNNWMYPGWNNPVYIHFVTSNLGSTLDFHQNNDAYFGGGMITLARTSFFSSTGGTVNPSSSNWTYAEVHINNNVYASSSTSNEAAIGTTVHEIGHAFGLAHYNGNPFSIMCQTAYGRTVQRVAAIDNDAVNSLY